MPEINMNGIGGPRPVRIDLNPVAKSPETAKPQTPNTVSDQVELSEEARKLLENQAASPTSSEARIEAARRKLLSGELSTPEALARTAEKLLQSDDLSRLDDKPAQ